MLRRTPVDYSSMPVRLDPAAAVMFGTRVLVATLAATQSAHEKECLADRERTRLSFEETRRAQEESERRILQRQEDSERRIAQRQDEMHADHSRRFDQIQAMSWRVAGVMILTLLSVIGFGLAHLFPLVKI